VVQPIALATRPTKNSLIISVVVLLSLAGAAVGSEIGDTSWNESNIQTLRSFDKAAVVGFLNEQRRAAGNLELLMPNEIGEFEWADLAGDGHYQLVLTLSGPCAHAVTISDQDTSGRVTTTQSLAGRADLKTAIRDLNGDGKDELILQTLLVEHDCANQLTWPAVYRLENGKYVEASRDFPAFYDNEVLPKLDGGISRAKIGHGNPDNQAGTIMVRDKILRVLGRDPTAGLQQAYQWMNSDDPDLLQDAAVTFEEIGGHEEELRTASASYRRALCERQPGMAVCENSTQR
jgi:hypothetical protein